MDLPMYGNTKVTASSTSAILLVPYDDTPPPSPSPLKLAKDHNSSETIRNPTADNTTIEDDLADLLFWVEKISGQVTAYAEKARRCKRKFYKEKAQQAKKQYEYYARLAYHHRSEYEDLHAQYYGRKESAKKKNVTFDDGKEGCTGDGGRHPEWFYRRGADYIPGKYAPKAATIKLSDSSPSSPAISLKVKPDHLDTSFCSLSWLEYWYVRRSIALQEDDKVALEDDFDELMEECVNDEERMEEEGRSNSAIEEPDLYDEGDDEWWEEGSEDDTDQEMTAEERPQETPVSKEEPGQSNLF